MAEHLANHDEPPERDDGWQDLAVANPTFLLERLGSECGDLQFLRELTVNGLDAIAAQPGPARGRVVWDLDWQRLEASAGKVRKLTVTDTGTGMRPDQLGRYINQLASSSREQSHTANFGVGAKVAAGSRNPHGLEYRSWHQGQGALVCFKRHSDGRWGLEPQPWPDGHHDYWRPLGEQDKPWLLRGQDHGTQVVLLGHHERDDTTQAPQSVSDARQHWITRYLNSRFRQFPDGIEVLVRDHHDRGKPGQLTRVQGERAHVERRAVCGGDCRAQRCGRVLVGARRRSPRPPPRSRRLDLQRSHRRRARRRALRPPGPDPRWVRAPAGLRRPLRLRARRDPPRTPGRTGRLEANTARTMLLLDHEPFPWTRWGEEFAAAMPEEIRRLQEHAASTDGTPRQDAIRGRVASILPLYRLSRYRPAQPPRRPPTARARPAEEATPTPVAQRRPADEPRDRPSTTRPPNAAPDAASIAQRDAGRRGPEKRRVRDSEREPARRRLVSARDGSRAPGDLDDQAARYHPARHELTINADFRAITDMIGMAAQLPRRPGRPSGDRSAGTRMVRTGAGRGRARRPSTRPGTRTSSPRSSRRLRSPPPCSHATYSTPCSKSDSRRNSGHRKPADELRPLRAHMTPAAR